MAQKSLGGFFENFLKKEPIFLNKTALQGSYTPEDIPHREIQIEGIAGILAPALRLEKPSNVFIYGKVGTGKSVSVTYVINKMIQTAEKNKIPIKTFYLNCKLKRVADTEYRLIAQLAREFNIEVPATGLPTEEIYKRFISSLEKEKLLLIIVLDEIDQLVFKIGDSFLYTLTRLNSELKNSQISFVGISNDLVFVDNLDPRIKSSLGEEELVFPPYNAIQLQSILRNRSEVAFREGCLEDGVIEKCSAYAAREHGDARRALELLRVSAEIAERKSRNIIKISDVDEAEEKIERDRVVDIINTQPKQFKIALFSIFNICSGEKENIFTGDVFEVYKDVCYSCGLKPLTQRRLSDIIAELDMLGIINAKVISKGRYGRTREISLAIPKSTTPKIKELLKEGLGL
nr:ORC1-type DNA replication protein [Candidatus Woesearchaeota archaeon]